MSSYIINTDCESRRVLIAVGDSQLSTIVRFMTQNNIWLHSIYWLDNTLWYTVMYEFGELIYEKEMPGKDVAKFYDECDQDGGRVLVIISKCAHT